MQTLWQEFSVTYRYPVIFTRDLFGSGNHALAEVLRSAGASGSVFPVADSGVVATQPALAMRMERYFRDLAPDFCLAAPLHVMPGGERCKNGIAEVEKLQALFVRYRLCRHSVVLAIGGGAVLDTVGYAAATAHRGIRLVRVPTTTLAQSDAGIGVKNGCNVFARKNFLGTFAPPFAVLNDFNFLGTQSRRLARAGLAEAVKVGLIKDKTFFDRLWADRNRLATLLPELLEPVIMRCAQLHLEHIAQGDPFELGSARPLDAGHWSAHAIEEMSGGAVLHGEAVAIGLALDAIYACEIGLLTEAEKERVLVLLHDLGFYLSAPALATLHAADALENFRQHMGGALAVTLPAGIGARIEVAEIDPAVLERSRQMLVSLYPLREVDYEPATTAAIGPGPAEPAFY